jgi:hypothetical protein
MAVSSNCRLMKYCINEMVSWLNDKLIKCQVDKMASW